MQSGIVVLCSSLVPSAFVYIAWFRLAQMPSKGMCPATGAPIIGCSMAPKVGVRLQRLSNYPVLLSTVKHGDSPQNVVRLERMLDY